VTRYVPRSPDNVVSFGSGRGLRGANVQIEGPRPAVVQPMSRVIGPPPRSSWLDWLAWFAIVLGVAFVLGCSVLAAAEVARWTR
jgi:hypothetical protein